jgi:hypothetical protein
MRLISEAPMAEDWAAECQCEGCLRTYEINAGDVRAFDLIGIWETRCRRVYRWACPGCAGETNWLNDVVLPPYVARFICDRNLNEKRKELK